MTALQTTAVAYDYEAGRWINAGDLVEFRDEWGNWRTQPQTGTLLGRSGWLVDILTTAGLRCHDLHVGTLHLITNSERMTP